MNNKLIAGIVSIAVIGVASYSLTKKTVESVYKPRVEAKFKAQDWKGASELYAKLHANVETGQVEYADIINARIAVADKKARGSRASLGLSWKEQGPDNVGGRTRALLIDKDDNQKLFVGSVGGGLFVSYDAANNWTRVQGLDDAAINAGRVNGPHAISTIAQAPNGDLYVGTGCSFEPYGASGNSGFMGTGVYKSTDGGVTWALLESADPGDMNMNSGAAWAFVNRIAIDQNSGAIFAGTNNGLLKSTDGGTTWNNVVHISGTDCSSQFMNTGTVHDVKITSDGTVIAVIDGNIYRSTTGAECSFDKISGLSGARMSIAISRADENYMYAYATNGGALKALYKSTDKGLTWSVLQAPISGYFELDTQGDYNVAIGASASNPNDIIVGAVTLWRHNGNLKRIAAEFPNQIPGGGYQYLVHSDKHDVVFDEIDENIVYVLTDGGVSKSLDGGNTWFAANRGYNVTQFYSVAYDNDYKMMAGAQDNGTQEVTGEGFFPLSAEEISGGDGFDCDYSQLTDVKFASVYYEEVRRGIDGSEMGAICNGDATANPAGPDCGSGDFFTKLRIWESKNDPTSKGTVEFENINPAVGVKKGDGTTRKFTGDFNHPKDGGLFVKGTGRLGTGGFKVYVGTKGTSSYQMLKDSMISSTTGTFVDSTNKGGVGTVNYATGEFEVTFGSAPTETQTVWGSFESMYPLGTVIALNSATGTDKVKIPLDYTLPANLYPGETVLVPDPVQSLFVAQDGGTVAITREALDLSKTPTWIRINGISGTAFAMEFSKDGNYLFVGTWGGDLYRVTGLNNIYKKTDINSNTLQVKQIYTGSTIISGVAVDPNDPNNVVFTLAQYNGTNKVYRSSNALANTPSFSSAQGDLPVMPCYDVIIDVNDGNKVVIGTEYGVWGTEDIWTSPVVWTDESGELGNVPVYALRQQTHGFEITGNKGEIYVGTHSRGMWRSGSLQLSTKFNDMIEGNNNEFVNSLEIFPNPMSETGFVTFNLDNNATGKISVFDINGRKVETLNNTNFNAGDNKVQLDVANYEIGTYFVTLEVEGQRKIAKFVVM